MAMPHIIFKRKSIERIKNLNGKEKIKEINEILKEMPKYKSGPYADIEKFLKNEIDVTKTRTNLLSRDFFAVKKQGDVQVVFVGMPSVGKSSLISKLSNKNLKIGSYDFTTIKPDSSVINYNGLYIQLVDLPGLIEDASIGKGLGKRILSVMHNADLYVFVVDAFKPYSDFQKILTELDNSFIEYKEKSILVLNKIDLIEDVNLSLREYQKHGLVTVAVSSVNNLNLEILKKEILKKSGFIITVSAKDNSFIPLRNNKRTVKDFCLKIHQDFLEKFNFAQVKGTSVKFENQKVGLNHVLEDGDVVKIHLFL
jgi:uncharacterized protein